MAAAVSLGLHAATLLLVLGAPASFEAGLETCDGSGDDCFRAVDAFDRESMQVTSLEQIERATEQVMAYRARLEAALSRWNGDAALRSSTARPQWVVEQLRQHQNYYNAAAAALQAAAESFDLQVKVCGAFLQDVATAARRKLVDAVDSDAAAKLGEVRKAAVAVASGCKEARFADVGKCGAEMTGLCARAARAPAWIEERVAAQLQALRGMWIAAPAVSPEGVIASAGRPVSPAAFRPQAKNRKKFLAQARRLLAGAGVVADAKILALQVEAEAKASLTRAQAKERFVSPSVVKKHYGAALGKRAVQALYRKAKVHDA
jgi:hypothetical protein